jgi:hypothetical protein
MLKGAGRSNYSVQKKHEFVLRHFDNKYIQMLGMYWHYSSY